MAGIASPSRFAFYPPLSLNASSCLTAISNERSDMPRPSSLSRANASNRRAVSLVRPRGFSKNSAIGISSFAAIASKVSRLGRPLYRVYSTSSTGIGLLQSRATNAHFRCRISVCSVEMR